MTPLPAILLVADSGKNLVYLGNVIGNLKNVTVIQASSGKEALVKSRGIELALAVIDVDASGMEGYELAKKINSYKEGLISVSTLNEETFNTLKATFIAFIKDILAIDKEDKKDDNTTEGLMELILELRKDVRAKKDFAASDKIRDQLLKVGIQVKDGKDGTSWTKN